MALAHELSVVLETGPWRLGCRCMVVALTGSLLWASAGDSGAQAVQPETGTGTTVRARVPAASEMVAAANPHAARAGARILAAGGSAIDAAIATQLVLNLVEPQSSGIGGGAFLLHHEAATGTLRTYDGRETAPAAARPDLFVKPDGSLPDLFVKPDGSLPGYFEALAGGRSVGVPGLLRMLEAAHRAHGKLPWPALFAPAIALAEAGFAISPRLNKLVSRVPTIARFPDTAAYFLDAGGMPKPIGETLRNPMFADTLRRIADGGADVFYRGAIAHNIVQAVTTAAVNPGRLSAGDLAGYASKLRPPVCLTYRGYRVCGMGPPSSGGLTVLQILGMLENFDIAALAPNSAAAVHLFAEASRLAYADRDLYIADSDFVAVPADGLLDRSYLRVRAALIDADTAAVDAAAGMPPGAERAKRRSAESPEPPGTSHVSIVDRHGNAVALTTSIEFAFGSGFMVRGFLLNNQLTDFSFAPEHDGREVANRVEPNKRPRSSMAPTMVFDPRGRLSLVVGSPGGSRIICYVAKTLVAVIDWGLDAQAAIDLPHRCNRGHATELERNTEPAALKATLTARGHAVTLRDMNSGLHAIQLDHEGDGHALFGAADPRREGLVAGR